MNISIQSTNPALAALETLALLQGGAANAGTATATPTPAAASPTNAGASIVDLSGAADASVAQTAGLVTSSSAADAAVSAGGAVVDLLTQMRQDAVSASDPSLSSDARAALDTGFQADLASISSTVAGASVDGLNLLDGSAAGASATVSGVDLSLGGPLIGLASDSSLSDPASAAAIADQLGAAVGNVGQAVGQIAAQGQALQTHLSVVAQAGLALQPGVAGAVNTGLDADGARLAALQVSQQLSTSSGSIASGAPQAILAMFR